jgi:hypothetical protein
MLGHVFLKCQTRLFAVQAGLLRGLADLFVSLQMDDGDTAVEQPDGAAVLIAGRSVGVEKTDLFRARLPPTPVCNCSMLRSLRAKRSTNAAAQGIAVNELKAEDIKASTEVLMLYRTVFDLKANTEGGSK